MDASSYIVDGVRSSLTCHPKLFTAVAASSLVFGVVVGYHVPNYQRWRAVGPGGVPHDLRGYLINLMLTPFSLDTKRLDFYDQPEWYAAGWSKATDQEKVAAQTSLLDKELPEREGPHPNAIPFLLPQRQRTVNNPPPANIKSAYLKAFDDLGAKNSDFIELRTSVLETRGKALFVKPETPLPILIEKCRGEICHIHTSDLSGHISLPFPDAKEVIEKGYGERHGLSGTKLIPLAYTMLYEPKSIDEIEVFVRIFQAGIDYVKTGGTGSVKR